MDSVNYCPVIPIWIFIQNSEIFILNSFVFVGSLAAFVIQFLNVADSFCFLELGFCSLTCGLACSQMAECRHLSPKIMPLLSAETRNSWKHICIIFTGYLWASLVADKSLGLQEQFGHYLIWNWGINSHCENLPIVDSPKTQGIYGTIYQTLF